MPRLHPRRSLRGGSSVVEKTTAKKTTAKEAPHGVLRGLPILWAHKLGGQAIGLHVDEREAWAGSQREGGGTATAASGALSTAS